MAYIAKGYCLRSSPRAWNNVMIVNLNLFFGFFAFKAFYHTYNITQNRVFVNIFSVVFLSKPLFGILGNLGKSQKMASVSRTSMYLPAPADNPGCKVLSGRSALPHRGGSPSPFAMCDDSAALTLTKRL